MSYADQVDRLAEHIRSGEKNPQDFSVGMEFEHLLLHKSTLQAVPFLGENGVECLLKDLSKSSWSSSYEERHLVGLMKDGSSISLEPAAQLEVSTPPRKRLRQISDDYFKFLNDIIPLVNDREMFLAAIGYQPVSLVADIPFIPKMRYHQMQTYLKSRGKYAHNMMKGTASTQVSVDFSNELDYIKKNRVINFLAPLIFCIFDNAPYFEGAPHTKRSARSIIWNNCDPDRCGAPESIYSDKFGYEAYAEYLLSVPSIVSKRGDKLVVTGSKKIREIFDPATYSKSDVEYLFTMVFPDVRTKTFIEIRMGDSVPYPYNISYAAFWKALLYNPKNLNTLYMHALEYNKDSIDRLKMDILENGTLAVFCGKTVFENFRNLLGMAVDALDDCEKKYLHPLISLTDSGMTLKDISFKNINKNVYDSIKWCFLNEFEFDRSCSHIACR